MKKAQFVFFLMISCLITMIVYDQVQHIPIEEPEPIERQVVRVTIPSEPVMVPTFEGKKFEPIFSINKIDDIIYNRMDGVSFKKNDHVQLDDLRYLTITYWGFDSKKHFGEMIVHQAVAEEVLDIFKELYEAEYPIEKMKLVDDYEGNDELSMLDNNTSAFNYRVVAGTSKLSNHAFGLAIDINPYQNPYVRGDDVQPAGSEDYVDRTIQEKGMILKDDICYQAFTSRGWTWGGDWSSIKDYQHFEKKINDN